MKCLALFLRKPSFINHRLRVPLIERKVTLEAFGKVKVLRELDSTEGKQVWAPTSHLRLTLV